MLPMNIFSCVQQCIYKAIKNREDIRDIYGGRDVCNTVLGGHKRDIILTWSW